MIMELNIADNIFYVQQFVIRSDRVLHLLSFQLYDVTRRDTFKNLSEIWSKEVELYSTNQDFVKMLVRNKVDKVSFVLQSCASIYKLWECIDDYCEIFQIKW